MLTIRIPHKLLLNKWDRGGILSPNILSFEKILLANYLIYLVLLI